MVRFSAIIKKFDKQGEKTGWTYIEVPAEIAGSLHPGNKKSFKVKGALDAHEIMGVSLLPMGEGDFILPLNAVMRKAIGKRMGAGIQVKLSADISIYELNSELMECLADEPVALAFFQTFSRSTQNYYSKWIESAKTETTRTGRIAMAVNALLRKMDYGAMLREARDKKKSR